MTARDIILNIMATPVGFVIAIVIGILWIMFLRDIFKPRRYDRKTGRYVKVEDIEKGNIED